MCVAIPGRIVSIDQDSAEVDFGGTVRTISLLMLAGLDIGDWIVSHSGYAVKQLTAAEAEANIECVVRALSTPERPEI